jgi:hypothetical protein
MSQAAGSCPRRDSFHFDALARLARARFERIPDSRRCPAIPLPDALMAGLAVFSLKDPSLLAFQRRTLDHNLRAVFGLRAIPSDTQMRTILDGVDPDEIRPLFGDTLRELERGKVIEDFRLLDGHYLIALDGVEYFRSKKVHCASCMTRRHGNGEVSYCHQMLGAVVVHPDHPEVIPLAPEPIQRQDGEKKNDCERNAARRWLGRFREDHPNLKVIVTEDGLSSNAPHIRDLMAAAVRFLLGVKPGDHKHLFDRLGERLESGDVETVEEVDARTKVSRSYVIARDVSLNEANPDVRVTVVHYLETTAKGECKQWTWVTDLEVTIGNVREVVRAGRARWRIENETFNTLKNQGYHFEHNYGHGEEHLSVVLAMLMMLAFLIDQVQQKCDPLFEAARKKKGPKCSLWEAMRQLFASFEVASMREVYEAIAHGYARPKLSDLVVNRGVGESGNTS